MFDLLLTAFAVYVLAGVVGVTVYWFGAVPKKVPEPPRLKQTRHACAYCLTYIPAGIVDECPSCGAPVPPRPPLSMPQPSPDLR